MGDRTSCSQWCLFVAWLVALIAMLFSLYSSEVLSFSVCHLCWYQRICLYPLALILGIAAFRVDASIIPYVIGLPILGGLFALYQYLEQMIPGFSPIKMCTVGGDCSVVHFKWLGFITYPFLSLVACVAITVLLLVAKACYQRNTLSW
jgi:disulfide bond formation protein DsbB